MRHPMGSIQDAVSMAHTHKHTQLGDMHQMGTMGGCDFWDIGCHLEELRRSVKGSLLKYGFKEEDINRAYADIGDQLEGLGEAEAQKLIADYINAGNASSAPPVPTVNVDSIIGNTAASVGGKTNLYIIAGILATIVITTAARLVRS